MTQIFVGRTVELPEHGIHTDEGFLFHHVGVLNLNSDMIERLHEFGTGYLSGTRFKPAEDDIIKRNWEHYAEEHEIDPTLAAEFAGVGDRGHAKDVNAVYKRRQFACDTAFWPAMCKGLPHRSAFQVKRRMLRLFDKAVLDGYRLREKIPLPYNQLMAIIHAYKRLGDMRLAAEELQMPYFKCANAYNAYLGQHGELSRSSWRSIWETVNQLTTAPEEFKVSLKRAIRRGDTAEAARLREFIDFRLIARSMTKRKSSCSTTWDILVEKFMGKYAKAYARLQSKKPAWEAARKSIFKVGAFLTAEKFSIFLRLLVNCVIEEMRYEPLRLKYVNMDDLEQKMMRFGVSGLQLDDESQSEAVWLVQKVQAILNTCENVILCWLAIKFTLKERVQIVSMAFDRQIEKAGFEAPKLEEGQAGETISPEDLVGHVIQADGSVFLETSKFIEAMVLFALKLDPYWIPPTAFKKYVEDEEVLKLFPEKTNNSALLNKGLLRDYHREVPMSRKSRRTDDTDEPATKKERVD